MLSPFRSILYLLALYTVPVVGQHTIQWQRNLGGSHHDWAYSIEATDDGGSILTGYTRSPDGDVLGHHGLFDVWVIKQDADGEIQWQQCLGGSGSEEGRCIRQTSDGGYIIAGYTDSTDGIVDNPNGGRNAWLIKLDQAGQMEWQRCYGNSDVPDEAFAIEQLADGGYIMIGEAYSWGDIPDHHGDWDVWLLRLDAGGDIIWSKYYGGSHVDRGRALVHLGEDGFVFTGWTNSWDGDVSGLNMVPEPIIPGLFAYDMWVVKVDQDGELQWQRCLGGTSVDAGLAIAQHSSGDVIVAGYTKSNDGDVTVAFGGDDQWIVRLTLTGELIWERTFGGSGGERIEDLLVDDEKILLVGHSSSMDGLASSPVGLAYVWKVTIDQDGEMIAEQSFGGSLSDGGYGIARQFNDELLIVGRAQSSDGDLTGNNGMADLWVLKLAPSDVGMNDMPLGHHNLQLFPNPAVNELHMNWTFEGATEIQVLDVTGRLVLSIPIQANTRTFTLSVSRLAEGTYSLNVLGGEKPMVQRFVKQ